MSADPPDTGQQLQYPPIRVNRSLAQLDIDTLIMRSNPRPSAHDAESSLEDSTYSVLTLGDLSDDDGHTASVASTSADDMSVKTFSEDEDDDGHDNDVDDEDDDEDEFEEHQLDESIQPTEPSTDDPLVSQVISAGEDSTLTERPSLGDSENGYYFKMEEHPADSFDGLDGISVVKEFTPEQSSSNVLKPYECSEIRLTVRAGLARNFYPDCASFKILFVGRMDDWSEEGIQASILKALVATGSSKSVMVRGHMETYSPVLHTDHCTKIEVLQEAGKEVRVNLTLEASEKATLSLGSRKSTSDLPDLAIFCYAQPSTITFAETDLMQARAAFNKHGIPCLDITDHRRFNEEQLGYQGNAHSLRVCVEGRTEQQAKFAKVDVLPVDVYSFIHLDPSDLNRHLAAISQRSEKLRQSKYSLAVQSWLPNSLVPAFAQPAIKSLATIDAPWKALVTVLALSGILVLSFMNGWAPQAGQYTPLGAQSTSLNILTSSTVSTAAITTPAGALSTTGSYSLVVKDLIQDMLLKHPQVAQASQPPKEVWQGKKEKGIKGKTDMSNPPRRAKEMAATSKLAGFEIQSSGEQQFVLRPSKDFMGRRRKPQLQIQVSRDAKPVPIRYERTMDGVYIVDLEEEYPIGSFNVTIATHSKPLMQQNFNIDLGHNKTRVQQWLSLLSHDLIAAQNNLRDLSSSIVQQAHDWTLTTERHLAGRVEKRAEELSHAVHQARDETWMKLRKATAPARTSRRILWARNNAYVWRCGVERLVGLSSKDKDGKKTRSCEASNW